MKIICLNNYSLEDSFRKCEKGVFPNNHLWGIGFIRKEKIICDILPFKKFNLLKKISFKMLVGDLDQQIRLLKMLLREKYDYIYTAHQNTIWFIAYLRKIFTGIPPIIAVLHSCPIFRNRIIEKILLFHLSRLDKIVCITRIDYEYLLSRGFSVDKVYYSEEGADCGFYKPLKKERNIILSVGKTRRDYLTLCEAVKDLDIRCFIVCEEGNISYINKEKYENVMFLTKYISYEKLFDLYNSAIAVVVPLSGINRKNGSTSLYEALAMGRPALVTRKDNICVDVEKHECGFSYGEKNSIELREKLEILINDIDMADRLGRNARLLVEKYYDTSKFGRLLSDIILNTSAKKTI